MADSRTYTYLRCDFISCNFTILLIFMQLTADRRGRGHIYMDAAGGRRGQRLAFILNFMPFLLLVVRHVAVVVVTAFALLLLDSNVGCC